MNNSQFVFFLAARLGCSSEKAEQYISTIVKWMTDSVVNNGQLILRDFGKFVVEKRNEYVISDEVTRKRMLIPPQLTLRFVAYPLLDEEEKKAFCSMEKVAGVMTKKWQMPVDLAEKTAVEFFKALLHAMDKGDEVSVPEWGTLQLSKIQLDNQVYGKVSFRPDDTLAEVINRPFSYFQPVELHEGVQFDDVEMLSGNTEISDVTSDTFVIKTLDDTMKTEEELSEEAPQQERTVQSKEAVPPEENPQQESTQPEEEAVAEDSASITEENPITLDTPQEETATMASETPTVETNDEVGTHEALSTKEETDQDTKPRKNFTGLIVLLGVVALIGLMILLFGRGGEENLVDSSDAKAVATNDMSAKAIDKDSISADTTAVENKENAVANAYDTLDYAAMNAKIPYGGYDIVGIDREITVVKGQTALSISKMMLGTEYTEYIVAANDGNDQPQPGQKYRIPKLKLRKNKK